jgi:preprotein translocase subunit SecE
VNRETKRMLQRQGQLAPDGTPARRPSTTRPAPRPAQQRTGPRQFTREVRGELRKVAWPTRGEVFNYTVIVLIALVVLTSIVFALDFLFSQFVLFLFE